MLLVTIGRELPFYSIGICHRTVNILLRVREEIELKCEVLLKMSGFLSVGNGKNDGEVLQIVKMKAAREYVRLESENHLTSEITYDEQYFEMRRDQTKLLEIMAVQFK